MMLSIKRCLPLLALAVSPAILAGENYVGVLKPTAAPASLAIPESGFYWPLAGPFGASLGASPSTESVKLKLGYRYSRFFAVETGFADFRSTPLANPLAVPAARFKGFGLETVGTLPLWSHASLYGRFGAWRSATSGPTSLLAGLDPGQRPGAGLRYGLGFKYDFTRRIGVQAEIERLSPLQRWGSRESDTDQVSVGVTWRF